MIQKINRGDVFYYDFGTTYDGSIEGKNRPCVVISNDKGNYYGTTVLVAPITSRSKETCKPWQVHFQNEDRSQVILIEQIRVVNSSKLTRYQGHLDELTLKKIDVALAVEFDLNVVDKELESIEFLTRLDTVLERIINCKLKSYEEIANARFNEKLESLLNEKDTKLLKSSNNFNAVHNELMEIKSLFNKNQKNIDNILKSLIDLYKNLNATDKDITMVSTDISNSILSQDTSELNEVKNADNLIKDNDADNDEIVNPKRCVKNRQPKINYENVQELLDFIKECNENSVTYICNKYGLTPKQLTNRKYLISKSLKKRNIPFIMIKKSRKDV